MLKKLLVITLLGLSSTAFAGGFQVKVGGSVIAPTDETKIAGVGTLKGDNEFAFTPSVEYFFRSIGAIVIFSSTVLFGKRLNC